MKNITLRVDEASLAKAREIAFERSTSVNAMIRECLDDLARQRSRRDVARKELLELCGKSCAEVGERRWTRDALHDR